MRFLRRPRVDIDITGSSVGVFYYYMHYQRRSSSGAHLAVIITIAAGAAYRE